MQKKQANNGSGLPQGFEEIFGRVMNPFVGATYYLL